MNRNEMLENIAQRLEYVISDRDNRGLLIQNNTPDKLEPLVQGISNPNDDKLQKISKIVKEIIMHDFGDTEDYEKEDSSTCMHIPNTALQNCIDFKISTEDVIDYSNLEIKAKKDNAVKKFHNFDDKKVDHEKCFLPQLKCGNFLSISNIDNYFKTVLDDLLQVTRQKFELEKKYAIVLQQHNSLTAQFLQSERRTEKLSIEVEILCKENYKLVIDNYNKNSQLDTLNKEVREYKDTICLFQQQKNQLLNDLYRSQQLIQKLKLNIVLLEDNLLESERKFSISFDAKEKLKKQVDHKVITQNQQKEYLQMGVLQFESSTKSEHSCEIYVERFISEQGDMRNEIKKRYEQEIEDLLFRFSKDKENLIKEIIIIQRERDHYLLEDELTKQDSINFFLQEKKHLLEFILHYSNSMKAFEEYLNLTCDDGFHISNDM